MPNEAFRFDNSYAQLPPHFYARQSPAPVSAPKLIRLNRDLAEVLGLDADALGGDVGAAVFSGNQVPEGAEPISLAYAGHQFGGWVPQLGDGRAVLLGEIVGNDGVRRDLQLKGSGQTPFSRGGDGRAALGPVLREYIVSEAMHAMGVPTTRSLAAVTTGDEVLREGYLPGAVLTRVATSHIRVGTFEFFLGRSDIDGLRTLADYVIDRHYPDARDAENPYLGLLENVIRRQASLVAKWFGIGFIHGVMNTDNTSVVGETIDYGPCAFMDTFHPDTVYSSIDHMGRYAFSNQPSILQWNLAQLAQCLLPVIDEDPKSALGPAQEVIDTFPGLFETELMNVMGRKLGFAEAQPEHLQLAFDLMQVMAEQKADFTNTFRSLADDLGGDGPAGAFAEWSKAWHARLAEAGASIEDAKVMMLAANPAVIPRNHLVEAAIRAAEDREDFSVFHALVEEVTDPFTSRPSDSPYVQPPAPHEVVQQTFCGT